MDIPIRATVLSALKGVFISFAGIIASGFVPNLQKRAMILCIFSQSFMVLHCPLTVLISFVSQESRKVEYQAAAERSARQAKERLHALERRQEREAQRQNRT